MEFNNQVRIGNWFNYASDTWWRNDLVGTPVQLTIDDFKDFYYKDDYFDFIELTPDILINSGFNNNRVAESKWFSLNNWFQLESSGDKFLLNLWGGKSAELQYVHQLQNLYLDLTGTELEIKF